MFAGFGGDWAYLKQVWLFILAPAAGAIGAGVVYPYLDSER